MLSGFYLIIPNPSSSIVVYDVIEAYKEGDMDCIFRHIIVMGPFITHYLKVSRFWGLTMNNENFDELALTISLRYVGV